MIPKTCNTFVEVEIIFETKIRTRHTTFLYLFRYHRKPCQIIFPNGRMCDIFYYHLFRK